MKRWDVTVDLAERFGLKTFAEIGVKDGKHVAEILSRVPGSMVVAVDPWASWSLPDPTTAEANFDKRVVEFAGRVTKLKMLGVEAAPLYPDGCFDYVFIDDDHKFETTHSNIKAWIPKVRRGGIIAGHDYHHGFPGVDLAVNREFEGWVQTASDAVWWVKL